MAVEIYGLMQNALHINSRIITNIENAVRALIQPPIAFANDIT